MSPTQPYARTDAGMSLIEVIVVLAVIGVMAGIAVLSIGTFDRSDAPDGEAQRLAARINLAIDMTIMEGRRINLKWDEQGYIFEDVGGASGDTTEPLGGRHQLVSSMRLIGSSPAGALIIREISAAGVTSFTLQGRERDWRVDFNGLSAFASPVPAQ